MKLMAWIALLTTLLFIGVVTLQVMEFMHYKETPNVWPVTAQ